MMNSNDITKLLQTKPHKYVVKDYTAKKSSTSCWSKFGLPAEIIDEKTNEFKIIDGFASLKDYFTTFVFRSGSKGTGTKNLTDHNCSNKDVNQPTLHEVIQEKTISDIHRTELIDSIANWCAINMRPFHCVEDPGFIIISQVLLDIRARYGRLPVGKVRAENILPCANTVKRRIQTLAGISRSEVATRLAAAGARGELAFSPDLRTDRVILEQNIELQDIHFAAAMLNPSYRSLRQATKEEQTRTQKYLRKRLEGITQSVASSALTHSDSDDDHDNRDYLARYMDNPPVSRKQDEVFRYLKFDHRETNTSDILEFWKTMA
ncbi:unnamed protein product, partial [Rotaria sp. Silwood1]